MCRGVNFTAASRSIDIDYVYVWDQLQHIINILRICNRNVITNFLPCSNAISPNNETCLVTCAIYSTWLMYTQFFL